MPSARRFFLNTASILLLSTRRRARIAGALVALVILATAVEIRSAAYDPATLAASKSMEAKLQILQTPASTSSAAYPAIIITEYEANSYMKVHSGESLPKGVGTPSVAVQPDHVAVSADVDFDELSRSYPNQTDMGPKILAAMFKGRQRAIVTGTLQSQPAGAVVQVQSVVVGSTTVPNWLVDYVVQNVLQPTYKFDLTKPQPYPDHVVKIVLGSHQVTFLRGPKPANKK